MEILQIAKGDLEEIHEILKILLERHIIEKKDAEKAMKRLEERRAKIIFNREERFYVGPTTETGIITWLGKSAVIGGGEDRPIDFLKEDAYVFGRAGTGFNLHLRYIVMEKVGHLVHHLDIVKDEVLEKYVIGLDVSTVQLILIPEDQKIILYNTGKNDLIVDNLSEKRKVRF